MTPHQKNVETLRDTIGDVRAPPLTATLPDKIQEAKVETTLAH